jgi:predicted O-methyltransferase YrrM
MNNEAPAGRSAIRSIARNALRPGFGGEMLRKLWLRWKERNSDREAIVAWCRHEQIDAAPWARSIDRALWDEAEAFAVEQQARAFRKSDELGMRVGGAGFYALLYFLTRLTTPKTIVETGVAFGFSSRAFLVALARNPGAPGRLYSSDFPYFRLPNPERLIGCLVEPELRLRWRLLIGSDRKNLRCIAREAGRIDLLHYDSDKSRAGRELALRILGPCLSREALVMFDDIQDNDHFRDLVQRRGEPYLVFEFAEKWIGLSGGPESLHRSRSTAVRQEAE